MSVFSLKFSNPSDSIQIYMTVSNPNAYDSIQIHNIQLIPQYPNPYDSIQMLQHSRLETYCKAKTLRKSNKNLYPFFTK